MSNISVDTVRELQRKIEKTSKLRFIASNRLQRHYKISQWAISLLSVILIIIPLLQALGVFVNAKPQVLNVVQVALAIIILVFSLLLGMDNYAVRAERMHLCGLEIADLARKMTAFTADITQDEYFQWNEKYQSILKGYENHTALDFKKSKLDEPSWYYPKKHQLAFAYVSR